MDGLLSASKKHVFVEAFRPLVNEMIQTYGPPHLMPEGLVPLWEAWSSSTATPEQTAVLLKSIEMEIDERAQVSACHCRTETGQQVEVNR